MGNETIRQVTAAGVVTTLAGTPGQAGYRNGPGSAAAFSVPSGVAVDRAGNVYVADGGNAVVRKISASGEVTTLAGIPHRLGSRDGPGSAAEFAAPNGIALDGAGNIYIADADYGGTADYGGNSTIRKITADGDVSTLAGAAEQYGYVDGAGGEARFSFGYLLAGLTVDRTGNVLVPDYGGNGSLRVVDPSGFVTTRADQLGAFASHVGYSPRVIAVDRNGNGFVATDITILRITPDGAVTKVLAAPDGVTPFRYPSGMAFDGAGNLYVSDTDAIYKEVPVREHSNGNIDQVYLTGASEAITADEGRITRISFLDLNDDIVQVEFSGVGTLTLSLEGVTGPVTPAKYNQPGVTYMKGHASLAITGADETSNLSVFSVGTLTAGNQSLFPPSMAYDAVADIGLISISSVNGKFGGLRLANASFFRSTGLTGINAPGVAVEGPVYLGDLSAERDARGILVFGSTVDVRVTGGDLLQLNNRPIEVDGVARMTFTAGTTSSGRAQPAQANRARLEKNGTDVTFQIVRP